MKNLFYKGRFIFIPIAVAAFVSLISFAVMQLWNHLLPDILHVTAITFWQAMGIFILCKILFGFGHKGGRGWGGRGGAPWMRHKMEERFKSMTPEEKEKFKQKLRERGACGPWGRGHDHPFNRDWDAFDKETEAKPTE
ncbi:MAG: hypothetical protein JWQ34_1435 [Mucilaginibacter sp.]|jgi:hypothetical protein|uniref:hypothetical protein n=1 Tax=Mucilaginibacter sp. TaxID=1882438 RepID=UPI002614392B|nr:hypothetical protein [Mucilaginibacter sp.]MDB5003210.1 hypothetical protein [Mucilaginibacter sp.]